MPSSIVADAFFVQGATYLSYLEQCLETYLTKATHESPCLRLPCAAKLKLKHRA